MSRDLHWMDAACRRMPGVGAFYWRRSARIKKAWCLALDRVGLLRPSSFVYWIATYRCNLACGFCEAGAGAGTAGELSTAEVRGVLEELRRMGVRRWLISGGEPAMRKDLPELMEYGESVGIQPGLITNGSLIEARWEELKRFRYFACMTSIDGPEAMHDRIRGKRASYLRAMRAVELFAEIGVPVRGVKTVVYRENLPVLGEMLERIAESGATAWQLAPVLPCGRAAEDGGYELDGSELREVVRFVAAQAKHPRLAVTLAESRGYLGVLAGCDFDRPFFCGAGLTRCAVMPNGDVLPCAQVYGHARAVGNVRERPLGEIWREGMREFRRRGRPAGCSECVYWEACQGGCWSEQCIRGKCSRDVWEDGSDG